MPVNQKDIARRLGINQATVSRALNSSPLISEDVRNRVMELSRKLGYHPNYLARSFSSKRSNVISVLKTGNLGLTRLQGQWMQYLHEATRAHGYMLRLDMAIDFERICGEQSADGLIVFGEENTDIMGLRDDVDIPMVFTDCGCTEPGSASVITDNEGGAASAVKYLANLGHRSIAFTVLVEDSSICLARHRGYQRALYEAGLPIVDSFTIKVPLWPTGFEHIEALGLQVTETIRSGVTGFMTINDVTAISIIKLLKRWGYRVPEDVSVVSFDDTLLNAMWEPSVTRVAQDIELAAYSTIDVLVKMMRGYRPEQIIVPTRLIVGNTTDKYEGGAI